jgi:tetratricopeptide (TPR) repeat protein
MPLVNSSSPTIDVPAVAACRAAGRPASGSRGRSRKLSWLLGLALLALFSAAGVRAWRRFNLDYELAGARQSLREFHPEEAIDRLAALTARRPDCAEAEFLLASAHRRARRLDLVQPHLQRAAELGWNQEQIDRQFCLTFFQAGDFRRSATELTDRLQQGASDDEAEEVYEALVRGYIAAMLLKQADFILDGWLQWRQSAPAHLLRAEVAVFRGNEALEMESYRDALRCDPQNYEARRSLARSLRSANDVAEAAGLCESCLRDRPRDPEILVILADCRARRGQQAEAKKLADLALASQPSQAQRASALALLGQIALEDKNFVLASKLYGEAVEAYPSRLPTVYALAQALSRAGRTDEAQNYQERFQRLSALENSLEDLRGLLLQDPGDPDVRAKIGEILLEMGLTQAGVNWLFSALLYDADNAGAHRRLAEYYEADGQPELAARHRAAAAARATPPQAPSVPFWQRRPDDQRAEPEPLTGKEAQ